MFCHEYEFNIVASKQGFIWLGSTGKVCCFCTKKCADNLDTFIMNGGYHWDRRSSWS